MSNLSRRSLVAGAASLPALAAGAAAVASKAEPDPIFALIDSYREAYVEHGAAIDAQYAFMGPR